MNKYEQYETTRPKPRVISHINVSYLESDGYISQGSRIYPDLNIYSSRVAICIRAAMRPDVITGESAMLILEEVVRYE